MLFHFALSLFVITNLKVLDFSVRIISMQLFHHIHDKQFSIPRSKGPILDILIEFFTYIMQFQSHHPTQYSFLLESVSMISQDPLTSSSRTSVFKLLETTSARSAEVLQGWYPLTSLTFNIKTIPDCSLTASLKFDSGSRQMKALPSYKLLVSWRKIQFINLLFFAFLCADRLTLLDMAWCSSSTNL